MSYALQKNRIDASKMMNCRSVDDVAMLLEVPAYKLQLLSMNPRYSSFKLPKADGSFRLIEAPDTDLKKILRRLNHFLQSVYFQQLPESVYGFVINPGNSEEARNLVKNAEQHLGAPYMLNADFEDFFHQVSEESVYEIFSNVPFQLSTDAAILLSRLVVYQYRLPMGSPTSPVLSNFACLEMDESILEYAKTNEIVYSRFADDLTFSSNRKISQDFFQYVTTVCYASNFTFNPQKIRWMEPNDIKEVTGLIVGDENVRIPDDFFVELNRDLKRIKHLSAAKYLMRGNQNADLLDEFSQHVEGKLQFVRMVYGEQHDQFLKYSNRYLKSREPVVTNQTLKWRDLPYSFLLLNEE